MRLAAVLTGEEKLELQPRAEADEYGVRNITGSSIVPVGQQFARHARTLHVVISKGVAC